MSGACGATFVTWVEYNYLHRTITDFIDWNCYMYDDILEIISVI